MQAQTVEHIPNEEKFILPPGYQKNPHFIGRKLSLETLRESATLPYYT